MEIKTMWDEVVVPTLLPLLYKRNYKCSLDKKANKITLDKELSIKDVVYFNKRLNGFHLCCYAGEYSLLKYGYKAVHVEIYKY